MVCYSGNLVPRRIRPGLFHHTTSETDLQGDQDQLTDVDQTEVVGHHPDEAAVVHGDVMPILLLAVALHVDLADVRLVLGGVIVVGVDRGSRQTENLDHLHQNPNNKIRNLLVLITEEGKCYTCFHYQCLRQHAL